MKKLTRQQKKHKLSRARYQLSKKSRSGKKHNVSDINYQSRLPSKKYKTFHFKAPKIFNLQYENVNEVLKFIAQLKIIGRDEVHDIFIDLADVNEFGEGAIAMLLTVIKEIRDFAPRKPIRGNQPKSETASDVLEKSGFFKHVAGHTISEKNQSEKNTMVTYGNANKAPSFLPKIIHQAMDTVWGRPGRNPLLYNVAFEMIRNSCDHAFKKDNMIKWYLASTFLDDQNLVKFSFVDNGKGILKTLNEGRLKNALNLFTGNVDILITAFKNGIKSRTGLSWRGKGLPDIFENYEENFIRNLIVITNDVFIDFDRKIQHKLDTPFAGTYYFWIVDQHCVEANFPL